jgi:ribonuclease HII
VWPAWLDSRLRWCDTFGMVGVDEVGRGCWAGPLLVVAARATAELPAGLKDSKLLSKIQRQKILDLLSICCDFGEGWVKAAEIDKHGLAPALRLGVRRALADLKADVSEEIIIDGKVNYLPKKFSKGRYLIDADNLVPIVSAASIYAKVRRDSYMDRLSKKYPAYGFERHVGYGTKTHQEALSSFGLIKYVHRLSYAPIARLREAS